MILFFSDFFRVLKRIFINISMNPLKTQTFFLYTLALAKGRLNVPTALGQMLIPSAQSWALILPSKTWEYVVKSAVYC